MTDNAYFQQAFTGIIRQCQPAAGALGWTKCTSGALSARSTCEPARERRKW
jgi:hypothetical protein